MTLEVGEMFWKLIISFLRCKKKEYIRTVPVGGSIYIVDIHKYVPIEQEIKQWKNALKEARASD